MSVADATLLDYETAVSHDITVLASSSCTVETFTINVINASDHDILSMTDLDSSINIVPEFVTDGALVGITASSPDPDTGVDTVTYRLLDDAHGRFAIDETSGVVTVADASSLIMRTLLHTVSSFRARVVMAQRQRNTSP